MPPPISEQEQGQGFTPGPWTLTPHGEVLGAHHRGVCMVLREEDGRLIAAAPELFDELEQWLFLLDSGQISGNGLHAFAERSRALIAKARDES